MKGKIAFRYSFKYVDRDASCISLLCKDDCGDQSLDITGTKVELYYNERYGSTYPRGLGNFSLNEDGDLAGYFKPFKESPKVPAKIVLLRVASGSGSVPKRESKKAVPKTPPSPTSLRQVTKLPLAGFHAGVGFVDDIDAAFAADDAAVLVALLGRFQGISNLHDVGPQLFLRRKLWKRLLNLST